MYIKRVHRLGTKNIGYGNKIRPIIVAFRDYYDTVLILEQAHRLKGTVFGLSRDYPAEISNARKTIWGAVQKRSRSENKQSAN